MMAKRTVRVTYEFDFEEEELQRVYSQWGRKMWVKEALASAGAEIEVYPKDGFFQVLAVDLVHAKCSGGSRIEAIEKRVTVKLLP